jgi:hypothetical protein
MAGLSQNGNVDEPFEASIGLSKPSRKSCGALQSCKQPCTWIRFPDVGSPLQRERESASAETLGAVFFTSQSGGHLLSPAASA